MAKPSKALLPAYLIVGEDSLKSEQVLKRLVARVGEQGDLDFNAETFDAEHGATGSAIVDAANTLPFLSEVRLVVVKNADRLAKADSEMLVEYLSDPCPTTVLALVATKLAKGTRLFKAVDKVGPKAVIDCSPKQARDLPALVQSMAQTHGMTMDSRAASELIDRIGDSTVLLDNEVRKVSDTLRARGEGAIKREDVEGLVARLTEVKPWELADALAERDSHRCAILISRLGDQSLTGMLSACVMRVRELIAVKSLDSRMHPAELVKALSVVNPRIRQEWQLKNHRRWAARFTAEELRRALDAAAEAERQMKSGGDTRIVLEVWALETCNGVVGR